MHWSIQLDEDEIVLTICEAIHNDLEDILKLQYLAYQSEAKLVSNFSIQPLTETLEEVIQEYENGYLYKVIDNHGRILGSVRGFIQENTLYIGKLIVHPSYQRKGIGTRLLEYMESAHPGVRKELYTSDKSIHNLRLYERMGYSRFKIKPITEELNLIYLEKD